MAANILALMQYFCEVFMASKQVDKNLGECEFLGGSSE